MSSWGEKRDRKNEEWNDAFAAQQRGIQNAQSYRGQGKTYSKKQTTQMCFGFMAIVILIIVVLVVVIVDF